MAERRTEHRRPLSPAPGPPRDLLDIIRFDVDTGNLHAVASVHTDRTERAAYDAQGRVIVSIAEDEVSAERLADGARSAWHEVEAELVDGRPDALADIDQIMLAAGARRGSMPKAARALQAR